jgi:predicted nucleic acid-binding Zn ribbon protein
MAANIHEDKGPENLSDVLGRLFTSRGWGRKTERSRLELAWAEVVGVELQPQTRVLGLRRGVLEIEVRNAVLIQELANFQKRKLLEGLRKLLTGMTISDLKFRAGSW